MAAAESVGSQLCLHWTTVQGAPYNCTSSQKGKLSFWVTAVLASDASSILSVSIYCLGLLISPLPVSEHKLYIMAVSYSHTSIPAYTADMLARSSSYFHS